MYCKKCGRKIENNLNICNTCEEVSHVKNSQLNIKKTGLPTWVIILIVVLPFIIVSGLLLLSYASHIIYHSAEEKMIVHVYNGVELSIPEDYKTNDYAYQFEIITDDNNIINISTFSVDYQLIEEEIKPLSIEEIDELYSVSHNDSIEYVEYNINVKLKSLIMIGNLTDGNLGATIYSELPNGELLVTIFSNFNTTNYDDIVKEVEEELNIILK